MTLDTRARPAAPGRSDAALARRLERYRSATSGLAQTHDGTDPGIAAGRSLPSADLAERLAGAVDGEVIRTAHGAVVRCETPSRAIPVDRDRLANLPGQPGPGVPLLCLDTETTGLATATGTVAFLIGLGWWEGERFRQVQLLLPDHGDEPALLAALGGLIPPDGWLVTYNGRGFDWPLLVTRYRMSRHAAPAHAGHLDLLPVVRRLFRHRLDDARLRTAEEGLLGLHRHGDVDGWEIPGRYLGFLRGGPVGPLVDVVRHNDQDVRSLARLLALLERDYGSSEARRDAPPGDLAGLARAFARDGRLVEALDCYDGALATASRTSERTVADWSMAPPSAPSSGDPAHRRATMAAREEPWWSPGHRPDFGGRPAGPVDQPSLRREAFAASWTTDRIAAERAHLLRRLGRWGPAVEAWSSLAAGTGRNSVVASIELAKLWEHRLRDPRAAWTAAVEGLARAERRRRLGRPEPRLEADLVRRATRLRRRLAAGGLPPLDVVA